MGEREIAINRRKLAERKVFLERSVSAEFREGVPPTGKLIQ